MALLDELTDQWRSAGINDGDMVLVHSSLRRTLLKHRGLMPEMVLDSFLAAVGEEGTLLLPTFNFDFTKGEPFDVRFTPSQMGALTEAGRRHRHAVRTWHPIYSFAVIGPKQPRQDHFSGYGPNSPFEFLHRNEGKIAILDLDDNNSMTYYHYVEETLSVPYRRHKKFTGQYTDATGVIQERTYGLFVRKDGVRTEVNPMGEILWESKLYSGCRPNKDHGLRVIRASDVYDVTSCIIRLGLARGTLYVD